MSVVFAVLAVSIFLASYSFWYTQTDPNLVSAYLYGVPVVVALTQLSRVVAPWSWYLLPVCYMSVTLVLGWNARFNPFTFMMLSLIAVWMSVYAISRWRGNWKDSVNWLAVYVATSALVLGLFALAMNDAFVNADVDASLLRGYIIGAAAVITALQFHRWSSSASWLLLPVAYLVALFGLQWNGYFMLDTLFKFCIYALGMLFFRRKLGAWELA